jgi:segregation and condensation protein B
MARKKKTGDDSVENEILDALPESTITGEIDAPPAPERIIEALLFIGAAPVTPQKVCEILRGVGKEEVLEIIAGLNKKYRDQNRPYRILPKPEGYHLMVMPKFHYLLNRLHDSGREAKLSPQALDTLALIAYRQPIGRQEIDSLRGGDTSSTLRLLIRLGLISVQKANSESRELHYETTKRFLGLFNLQSLDDLPRHQDPAEL